jgi:hypothetical protein
LEIIHSYYAFNHPAIWKNVKMLQSRGCENTE